MRIVIAGAGIAGLSTAIALKLRGFDADVYERRAAGKEEGAGIVCWPNASFVLDKLGMLDDITALSGRPVKMQRLSDQGEDLGFLDIKKLDELMGYPSLSILRKDLMKILVSHAGRLGINIHYGQGVIHLVSTSDTTTQIQVDNGTTHEAELVIGADGRMNSAARSFVTGNNQPVFQGFINWTGIFEGVDELFDEIAIHDYWGTGQRFGIVPLSANRAYWAGAVSTDSAGEKPAVVDKQELLSLFQHWPKPISLIIDQTPVAHIQKIDLHDHDPMVIWHRNNVLLVGDAAHASLPTSGQGACQALEDAWHLAELMHQDHSDLQNIFQNFTRLRQKKTTGITLGARQFADSLFNNDTEICRQRNLRSKATDYQAVVDGIARSWGSGLPLNPSMVGAHAD